MDNTYFVAPSLPPLTLGEAPEISFQEFSYRLEMNLGKKGLRAFALLRLTIDLDNIRSLYSDEPLDKRGNLSEKELDEALLVQADLPEYVFDFLNQFDETKEKVRNSFGLLSRYFAEEIPKQKGFVKNLLILQRQMRLVLTALRAKRMKRDVVAELQFEELTDPMVAQILAQKDMEEYEPPVEFQDLKNNLMSCGDDPWEQYKVVLSFEFEKIREMTAYPLFSLDWILGYAARLLLAEKWNALDAERGAEIVEGYKTGR